jgi:purine-binding chemotaxis protein CheW
MERECDKLVFDLDGRQIALDLASVDSVVEVQRVFFMPGQRGPVKGMISKRGEAVTVVDLRRVFGLVETRKDKNKIVIVRDGGRVLGLSIGGGNCTFLWKEDLKGPEPSHDLSPELSEQVSRFTSRLIEKDGKPIELLNWVGLYDEATSVLKTGAGGEDTHS